MLPGDMCWLRQFFDVIQRDCLPVVLEWEVITDNGQPARSWHLPTSTSCPLECVYPFFPRNTSNINHDIEIDYDSFVVKAPGNATDPSNLHSLFETMSNILQNPQDIKRRQLKMMQYAPWFTFGIGREAHEHNDGFALLLRALGHAYGSKG